MFITEAFTVLWFRVLIFLAYTNSACRRVEWLNVGLILSLFFSYGDVIRFVWEINAIARSVKCL